MDYKRDEEVWNSCSIWGSSVDIDGCANTGSSDAHAQWFSHQKIRADNHAIIM